MSGSAGAALATDSAETNSSSHQRGYRTASSRPELRPLGFPENRPDQRPAVSLHAFLELVQGPLGAGEQIEIRALHAGERDGPRLQRFDTSVDGAIRTAAALAPRWDVYFGVGPRRGSRGKKENTVRVGAAWGDVDFKVFPDGEAGARATIHRFPLQPSLVVASGGGYQPYWLLQEPVRPEEFPRLEDVNRGLAVALGRDGQRLDAAIDASRVLRVPGTRNHKYAPPRAVQIAGWHPEQRYTLNDLEAALEQCGATVGQAARAANDPEVPDSAAAAGSAEAGAPDESMPVPEVEALIHRALAALPQHHAGRLLGLLEEPEAYLARYPSRSELEFQAVVLLAKAGLADTEIRQVWRGSALGAREKVQQREDYLLRTVAAVRASQTSTDSIRPPIDTGPGRIESDGPSLFRSPAQLAASAPPEVEWQWEGYLAPGALTALAAREKTGKSTLAYALLPVLLDGGSFLGRLCRSTGVVYLSEEPDAPILEKLERFGLAGEGQRISLVTRTTLGTRRLPLPTVVNLAIVEAERIGAELLVVDTLTFWAQLPPEAENDSGAMQQAMRPLLDATSRGLAVLVLHHLTKTTGELRGSTAIAAAADIVLTLHRDTANRRRLDGVGRYQATPERVVIELDGNTYRALGTPATVEAADRVVKVFEALPREGKGATQAELAEQTELSKERVSDALREIMREGRVTRCGGGVKRDPYRYLRADSIPPDPLSGGRGGQVESEQHSAQHQEVDSIRPGPVSIGGRIEFEQHDGLHDQPNVDSFCPAPLCIGGRIESGDGRGPPGRTESDTLDV